ncbi:hypothetical protein AB0L41_48245 [Amycolatopsis mediterranei]|uniref:hypothetical protein n=1 Tax=Amycolatopsis mediterranei TaxID=33910 RepID=UPI00341CD21D
MYPDRAKRARYHADTPGVCRSAGWYSFADDGTGPIPAVAGALFRDFEMVTGSSTSPSSWLVITAATVSGALSCASQVRHWSGGLCGANADDGPTIRAPAAIRRTSVSSAWYCTWCGGWARRRTCAVIEVMPVVVADPYR